MNWYVPIPLIVSGSAMVTVGRVAVYPIPAFCTNIELTRLNPLPESPIEAIPIARSLATPAAGADIVTAVSYTHLTLPTR